MSLTRHQTRKRNRQLDREERRLRKAGANCYMCALSDWTVPATHGQLCHRHFDEIEFPRALDYPDY